jgi:hypothetical protein
MCVSMCVYCVCECVCVSTCVFCVCVSMCVFCVCVCPLVSFTCVCWKAGGCMHVHAMQGAVLCVCEISFSRANA